MLNNLCIPESQLVEAAQNGDLESFGKLYTRYYAAMVRLAYTVLPDRSVAEDCAQEAFALACENISQLRQPRKFPGWMAGICRNVARQWAKQRQKENVVTKDLPTGDSSGFSEQNNDGLAEVKEAIQNAIDGLPKMYQEPLILHYWSHKSYEEIGGILGIGRSVAKGRLFRARQKVLKGLRRKGLNKR